MENETKNCLEREVKTSELVSVKEILSEKNAFRIPDYQRGYAWIANEQFKDLIDDIYRIYINNLDKKHYTGMLALEEIKDDDDKKAQGLLGCNAFYVVDGQQRLTSLVIIIQSLINYIEIEDKEYASKLKDLLSFNNDTFRFDYAINISDKIEARDFFHKYIYDNVKQNNFSNFYLRNIKEANDYIDDFVLKFTDEEAKKFLDIILNQLVFNIYFIDKTKGFDVRVTFETMNNRGKKLSNLELLKNRLLYLSTFFETGSNFESKLKDKINNAWKNIYENLCFKNWQLSDDEYLQAHWIVYGALDKNKGDSYINDLLNKEFSINSGKFLSFIKEKKFDEAYDHIKKYVDSLEKYSKYWGIVNYPTSEKSSSLHLDPKEIKYLDRLNRICSMKYVKATLMTVSCEQKLSLDKRIEFYDILESSIFINKLIKHSRNDYSSLITCARSILNSDDKDKNDRFDSLMNIIKNEETEIGFKKDLNQYFLDYSNYLKNKIDKNYMYSWDGLRYFLYEYNESLALKTDKGYKKIEWDAINENSIEHILPQTIDGEKYWEIVLSPIKNDSQKIKRFVNSLGNLLLLSKEENSTLQNYSFPVKKEQKISSKTFAYKSGTRAAQKVAEEQNWTLDIIKKRELELYKFMFNRWIKKYFNISEEDFLKILYSDDNILISYDDCSICLSEDDLNELNSLVFETKEEMENVIDEEKQKNNNIFNNIRKYFKEGYNLKLNARQTTFDNKRYLFKIKNDIISCKKKEEGIDWEFRYYIKSNDFSIYKDRTPINSKNEIENYKNVLYFIETFKRFVRMYYKKNLEVKYFEEIEEIKNLANANSDLIDIYNKIKKEALEKFNLKMEPKQTYIAFKNDTTNIFDIKNSTENRLDIYINMPKGTLNDSKNYTHDVSEIGHNGNGNYRIFINNTDNLDYDYLFNIIKQSVEYNKK